MKRLLAVFLILMMVLMLVPLSYSFAEDELPSDPPASATPSSEAGDSSGGDITPAPSDNSGSETPTPPVEDDGTGEESELPPEGEPEVEEPVFLNEIEALFTEEGGSVIYGEDFIVSEELVIPQNITLTLTGTVTIPIDTTFFNNGTLTIDGTILVYGTFNNNADATVGKSGSLQVLSKQAHEDADGLLLNSGTMDVFGAVTIEEGATFSEQNHALVLQEGGSITGTEYIVAAEPKLMEIQQEGLLETMSGESITVSNATQLINAINSTSPVYTNITIQDEDFVNLYNALTIPAGKTVTVSSEILLTFSDNEAILKIEAGAALVVDGKLKIYGGSLDNYGTLTINGVLEIDDVFRNYSPATIGGTLLNKGLVSNYSSLTINGRLENVGAFVVMSSGALDLNGTLALNGTGVTIFGSVDVDGAATITRRSNSPATIEVLTSATASGAGFAANKSTYFSIATLVDNNNAETGFEAAFAHAGTGYAYALALAYAPHRDGIPSGFVRNDALVIPDGCAVKVMGGENPSYVYLYAESHLELKGSLTIENGGMCFTGANGELVVKGTVTVQEGGLYRAGGQYGTTDFYGDVLGDGMVRISDDSIIRVSGKMTTDFDIEDGILSIDMDGSLTIPAGKTRSIGDILSVNGDLLLAGTLVIPAHNSLNLSSYAHIELTGTLRVEGHLLIEDGATGNIEGTYEFAFIAPSGGYSDDNEPDLFISNEEARCYTEADLRTALETGSGYSRVIVMQDMALAPGGEPITVHENIGLYVLPGVTLSVPIVLSGSGTLHVRSDETGQGAVHVTGSGELRIDSQVQGRVRIGPNAKFVGTMGVWAREIGTYTGFFYPCDGLEVYGTAITYGSISLYGGKLNVYDGGTLVVNKEDDDNAGWVMMDEYSEAEFHAGSTLNMYENANFAQSGKVRFDPDSTILLGSNVTYEMNPYSESILIDPARKVCVTAAGENSAIVTSEAGLISALNDADKRYIYINGSFSLSSVTEIPAGVEVTVQRDGELTVPSGHTLTVNGAMYSASHLQGEGSIILNGTLVVNGMLGITGELNISSTSTLTINQGAVMRIGQNTGRIHTGVRVAGALNVFGNLNMFNGGILNIDDGGTLALKSSQGRMRIKGSETVVNFAQGSSFRQETNTRVDLFDGTMTLDTLATVLKQAGSQFYHLGGTLNDATGAILTVGNASVSNEAELRQAIANSNANIYVQSSFALDEHNGDLIIPDGTSVIVQSGYSLTVPISLAVQGSLQTDSGGSIALASGSIHVSGTVRVDGALSTSVGSEIKLDGGTLRVEAGGALSVEGRLTMLGSAALFAVAEGGSADFAASATLEQQNGTIQLHENATHIDCQSGFTYIRCDGLLSDAKPWLPAAKLKTTVTTWQQLVNALNRGDFEVMIPSYLKIYSDIAVKNGTTLFIQPGAFLDVGEYSGNIITINPGGTVLVQGENGTRGRLCIIEVVNNNGTLQTQGGEILMGYDGTLNSAGRIDLYGATDGTAGLLTNSSNTSMINTSGTLEVFDKGVFTLGGGAKFSQTGGIVRVNDGGTITDYGYMLVNSGRLEVGSGGLLNIYADFVLRAAGTLEVKPGGTLYVSSYASVTQQGLFICDGTCDDIGNKLDPDKEPELVPIDVATIEELLTALEAGEPGELREVMLTTSITAREGDDIIIPNGTILAVPGEYTLDVGGNILHVEAGGKLRVGIRLSGVDIFDYATLVLGDQGTFLVDGTVQFDTMAHFDATLDSNIIIHSGGVFNTSNAYIDVNGTVSVEGVMNLSANTSSYYTQTGGLLSVLDGGKLKADGASYLTLTNTDVLVQPLGRIELGLKSASVVRFSAAAGNGTADITILGVIDYGTHDYPSGPLFDISNASSVVFSSGSDEGTMYVWDSALSLVQGVPQQYQALKVPVDDEDSIRETIDQYTTTAYKRIAMYQERMAYSTWNIVLSADLTIQGKFDLVLIDKILSNKAHGGTLIVPSGKTLTVANDALLRIESASVVKVFGDLVNNGRIEVGGRLATSSPDNISGNAYVLYNNGAYNDDEVALYIAITGPSEMASESVIWLEGEFVPAEETPPYSYIIWSLAPGDETYATIYDGDLWANSVTEQVTVTVYAEDSEGIAVPGVHVVTIKPLSKSVQIRNGETVVAQTGQATKKITLDMNQPTPTLQLAAAASPEDAFQTFQWRSSVPSIASVNEDTGEVTGHKFGTALITVTADDGSNVSASVTVNVTYLAKSIEIAGNAVLYGGKAQTLRATVLPGNTSNKAVTWVLGEGDNEYASLSSSGVLTAKAVTEEHVITAFAAARDGSGVTGELQISILPSISGVFITRDVTQNESTTTENVTAKTLVLNLATSETIDLDSFLAPDDVVVTETWQSKSSKIAMVDEHTGVVSGLQTGSSTIMVTVTDGAGVKKTAACVIQVTNSTDHIQIASTSAETSGSGIRAGTQLALRATLWANAGETMKATDQAVTWSVRAQDAAYASVTTKGVVATRAISEDIVQIVITATAKDNGVEQTFTILLVPPATQVFIHNDILANITGKTQYKEYAQGGTLQLSATTTPDNAADGIAWKSSAPAIASVDATGLVTFKKAGSVTITATAADGSSKRATVVICTQALVTDIQVARFDGIEETPEIQPGGKVRLIAVVSPTTASSKNVAWTLDGDGSKYATINKYGEVIAKTAVFESVSVIARATAKDGSGVSDSYAVYIAPADGALQMKQGAANVTNQTIYADVMDGANTVALDANVFENGATAPAGYAVWSTSNKTLFTLSKTEGANTVVTVLGSGKAVIYAKYGGKSVCVTIVARAFTRDIAVSTYTANASTSIGVGKKVGLRAVAYADMGHTQRSVIQSVTWSLAWPDAGDTRNISEYAIISSAGIVTARGGVTEETVVHAIATSADGSNIASAPFAITLYPVVTLVQIWNATDNTDNVTTLTRTLDLKAGSTITFNATTLPSSAHQGVIWNVSNAKIAQITETSESSVTITALQAGTVTITARANDGTGLIATTKMNVLRTADDLSIASKSGVFEVAGGTRLTLLPDFGVNIPTNKRVNWSLRTEDAAFASINADGILSTKTVTSAKTIMVTVHTLDGSDLSASKEITICPVATHVSIYAGGIQVARTGATIQTLTIVVPTDGETLQLTAYTLPSAASNAVTWKTSSAAIATVDATGLVTAKRAGIATMTAFANDGSGKTASVRVRIVTATP